MFMNGRVVLEQGKIPCLVVESVTEADDLNIELYQKTIYLLKKLVIEDDNTAIRAFKKYQMLQESDLQQHKKAIQDSESMSEEVEMF